MTSKDNLATCKIGNTTYYVKATTKANAVHDFKVAIDRLIKKELQKQKVHV